ncbi:hypothetical protein NMG60_11034502 [Bertholletia excelsa]
MEVSVPLLETDEREEEVGLRGGRRPRHQNGDGHAGNGNVGVSFKAEREEEEVGWVEKTQLEKNRGDCSRSEPTTREDLDAKLKDVDIQKILSIVIRGQDEQTLRTEISSEEEYKLFELLSQGTKDLLNVNRLQGSEDEEIELEFQKAVESLDQHSVHCPNCNSSISKVVIRKRKRVDPIPKQEPINLLGCLSCFSIFIPSGNCFNLFRIFQRQNGGAGRQNPSQMPLSAADSSSNFTDDKGNMANNQQSSCFNLFWIFKNKQISQQTSVVAANHPSNDTDERGVIEKQVSDLGKSNSLDEALPNQNNGPCNEEHISDAEKGCPINLGAAITGTEDAGKIVATSSNGILGSAHHTINIDNQSGSDEPQTSQCTKHDADALKPITSQETRDSKTMEILKSIVYGGLVESMASLSVVSSAAAADATTVNVLAMGLANLVGGLFMFGHNLRELKLGQVSRYQESLGQRENFLLHATVAVISFLIFGSIPPVAYGFSFRQSDDKDLKILVVAAASFLCIAMLAIGKAYTKRSPGFWVYIKTVLYYLTVGVTTSGISYVAGNLISRLMDKLGWFNSGAPVSRSFPQVGLVNPAWGSF